MQKSVRQSTVLLIDLDNGERRLDERIGAISRHRDLPAETPIQYLSMPLPWLDVTKEDHSKALQALIELDGAELVIIDNLASISGDTDENSAQMTKVMGSLRRICESTDAAIIVVHHQRKGNSTGGRKGDRLRGHSSIEASIDLALLVERKENSPTIKVTATKTRGADVSLFYAAFAYEHKTATRELETACFFGESANTGHERQGADVEMAIRISLNEGSRLNQGQLVDAVQGLFRDKKSRPPGINSVREHISSMVESGNLIEEHKGNAIYYSLSPS